MHYFCQTVTCSSSENITNDLSGNVMPSVIMHSAADYGSWFSPKMCSFFCSWVCLRSDRVLTTNEPLQGSFENLKPLQGGLGTLVWSTFGAHPSAIAAFSPAQTNRTKRENEL